MVNEIDKKKKQKKLWTVPRHTGVVDVRAAGGGIFVPRPIRIRSLGGDRARVGFSAVLCTRVSRSNSVRASERRPRRTRRVARA